MITFATSQIKYIYFILDVFYIHSFDDNEIVII